MKFLGREVNENLIGVALSTSRGTFNVTDVDPEDVKYPIQLWYLGWVSLEELGSSPRWLDNKAERSTGTYRLIEHPGASPIEKGIIRALLGLSEDTEIISLPGKIYILATKENQCES